MTGRAADDAAGPTVSVAVVGSANLDLVVPVERHPRPGETVLGGDHYRAPGGKGANQAVAAARLGGQTSFVGLVGDDDAGRTLTSALRRAGVDTGALGVHPEAPSGLALIAVDPHGENTIVVSPGANARVGPEEIAAAEARLRTAGAVLLQLEIPLPAVAAAAAAAGGLVILNPAPAAPLPAELLERVDVLVPNRTELATLAGTPVPETLEDVERAADALAPERIVVTLGADGALVCDRGTVEHVPALEVEAVDATAAGDAFCGALAVALVGGVTLADAARRATVAAALAVTRKGAQPSLPTASEVAGLLEEVSR